MTPSPSSGDTRADDLFQRKRQLRAEMRQRFKADVDRGDCSRRLHERLTVLPEFIAARTVCIYVSTAAEIETHALLDRAWQEGKRVVVPCCRENELHLFDLHSMTELTPRTLGILEPHNRLRDVPGRWLAAGQIELFLVPGLAFDRMGGRLGHGKGYYDRLLARAAPGTPKIALAFSWQLIDHVPMGPNDVWMDAIVTEEGICRSGSEDQRERAARLER